MRVERDAGVAAGHIKGELQDPLSAQLMQMPNVLIPPHVSFYTNLAIRSMVDISLDDVLTIVQGGTSDHTI